MFSRPTDTAPVADDLVTGALPDRVRTAHERLVHQHDPALLEARSERELDADRALAELTRDHERDEQRAAIQAAADTAHLVRRTAGQMAEREAADLLRAAQAIGEQRHAASPHAKVARLHRRKPRVLALLAGVVAFSMLFSAVTVQQNIAPTGGVTNPMFWLSYGLEAIISCVLVALMLSTADTAEWGAIENLWQVYVVEGLLLAASVALNTFPYVREGNWSGAGVHVIAPVMIGVALITHRLVAARYGHAIAAATAAVPDHEDLQARLTALTRTGAVGNQILPATVAALRAPRPEVEPAEAPIDVVLDTETETDPVAENPVAAPVDIAPVEIAAEQSPEQPADTATATEGDVAREMSMTEFEREFTDRAPRAEDTVPIAIEQDARATDRDRVDRAPIAIGTPDPATADRAPRAARETVEQPPRAGEDTSPIAIGARPEHAAPADEPAIGAHADESVDRDPIADHNPLELGTDRDPIADRDTTEEVDDTAEDTIEPAPVVEADRDRRAVVTLVRAQDRSRSARADTDRAPIAARDRAERDPVTEGALARAAEHAPIARARSRAAGGEGVFARAMSSAEATRLARAVTERGKSRQPVEVLARIYRAHSEGDTPTGIGKSVGLPHSTVVRALQAATAVIGPRPVE